MHLLAQGLKKLGHEVIIASSGKYIGFKNYLYKKIKKFPFFGFKYFKNSISYIIKKEKIDIVHTHDYLTAIPAILAAKENHIKSVTHFRDYWFACPKGSCLRPNLKECKRCCIKNLISCSKWYHFPWMFYKHLFFKSKLKILKQADAKICVSSAVKNKLLNFDMIKSIYITYNSRCFPQKIKKIQKQKEKFYVGFFGNFSYTKGIKFILNVMKNIVNKNRDVGFLMVGDGPLRCHIQNFILKNNLSKNFKLLGKVKPSDVWPIYSKIDVVVLPSLWAEPFSGIILEAMFSAKPIIASNTGGTVDVVKEGKTGFLVNPSNLKAWENKIQLLINDPKLKRKLGKNAKEKSKQFTPKQIAKKTEAIYKNLF